MNQPMNDTAKQTVLPMETSQSLMLESSKRAEIDMQIATAKRYPRSIEQATAKMKAMVSYSQATAEDCFYILPKRKGSNKCIEGPSVRLAEMLLQCWGNVRVMTLPPVITHERVTIEWSAIDLETNTAVAGSASNNILYSPTANDPQGKRYSENMINTICLATAAKAMRNATYKIVPGTIVKEMCQLAQKVAVGGDVPIESLREKWMSYFRKSGISDERILSAINVSTIEQIEIRDITVLQGITTAIKDGQTTLDEAFPPIAGSEAEPSRSAKDLTEKLHAKVEDKPKPAEVNNERTGEPAVLTPWEQLIDQLAGKCGAQHADAATRLIKFIENLWKATPDTLTDTQITDLHSKIESGEIVIK